MPNKNTKELLALRDQKSSDIGVLSVTLNGDAQRLQGMNEKANLLLGAARNLPVGMPVADIILEAATYQVDAARQLYKEFALHTVGELHRHTIDFKSVNEKLYGPEDDEVRPINDLVAPKGGYQRHIGDEFYGTVQSHQEAINYMNRRVNAIDEYNKDAQQYLNAGKPEDAKLVLDVANGYFENRGQDVEANTFLTNKLYTLVELDTVAGELDKDEIMLIEDGKKQRRVNELVGNGLNFVGDVLNIIHQKVVLRPSQNIQARQTMLNDRHKVFAEKYNAIYDDDQN